MAAQPAKSPRAPLGELPLAAFAPPLHHLNAPPSPVSLPGKRGPPTDTNGDAVASATPKRRVYGTIAERIVTLDTDDLGTGKSPARKLFAERPAPASTPSVSTPVFLVPSPALASSSRRRPLLQPVPMTVEPASTQPDVHDVGFVIFSDEYALPRPLPPQSSSHSSHSVEESNDENAAPERSLPTVPLPTTPNTARRIRAFERSRLGVEIVSASRSPPSDDEPPAVSSNDKDALKREVDTV
ncbi:uncharacterized protein LOC62_04G006337 [Vanrija pseudolonga]|uniref:Uncharacterized protein n=1 Tax=Vanrija pseudolonga TaxID=143232 RepID=A0AAF0YA64_9TREE|nr:hypothetical protein LOC62_04G006337 [Vanrija pseudolonga]